MHRYGSSILDIKWHRTLNSERPKLITTDNHIVRIWDPQTVIKYFKYNLCILVYYMYIPDHLIFLALCYMMYLAMVFYVILMQLWNKEQSEQFYGFCGWKEIVEFLSILISIFCWRELCFQFLCFTMLLVSKEFKRSPSVSCIYNY